MGRHKRYQKKQGQDRDQSKGVRGDWEIKPKHNEQFVKYYQAQGIVPEGEWEAFIETLKEPLPATFRITGSRSQAKEVLKYIEGEYFQKVLMAEKLEDGTEIEPPKCLEWYPDRLAWQLSSSRKALRQNMTLKRLHQFMVSETESGFLSRQEAVSMIPPLLLDIQPQHKILDMCAAPGSKTSQLIEYLHWGGAPGTIPDGFVVANDSDNKRCYLMVHQVKRLMSPCFMIINHDATQLPSFRLNTKDEEYNKTLKYDRVLADVPCSGDGTMRKNPDVWYKWNAAGGNNLHHLQLRILRRGLEMLEIGGRLVYSTCSFNPIEDEAVLSSTLQACEGSVELVDVSGQLPGLKTMPGIAMWKVHSRDGEVYEQFSDVPERLTTQIRPSMFPPSDELAKTLNLHRAMRVLPHHQDTGGFFIAVLTKTDRLPWMRSSKKQEPQTDTADATKSTDDGSIQPEEAGTKLQETGDAKPEGQDLGNSDKEVDGSTEKNDATASTEAAGEKVNAGEGEKRKYDGGIRSGSPPPQKKMKYRGYKEDPFIFLSSEDPMFPPVEKYFQMSSDFPVNQLMVRCDEGKRRHVYFTSKIVRDLVENNKERIRFINMGLKVLSRSDSKYTDCEYRLVQEGVSIMDPYITKRKVELSKEDIVTLLSSENPFLTRFSDAVQKSLAELKCQGSLIYYYDHTHDDRLDSPQVDLVITGWLGRTSTRSFLPINERAHYLRLCGSELKTKEEIMEEKAKKKEATADGDVPDNVPMETGQNEVDQVEDLDKMDGEKDPQNNGVESITNKGDSKLVE